MFKRKEARPLFVEVEKGAKLDSPSPEMKEALKALPLSGPFQYLLSRLKVQTAMLQGCLANESDMSRIPYLQAGVFWTRWLDNEIKLLTSSQTSRPREATQEEASAFDKIRATLESVGVE